MALNLKDKQAIVAEISKVAKSALSAVIADYSGVTVNKMTELRKAGREAGVYMRVVRNKLMNRVIKDTPFECLKNMFTSPTLIAFSNKHPGTAARLFQSFSKDNTNLKIKVAAFEGKIIPASNIDYLASLPTYKEVIACLIWAIKEASAGKLVRTLVALQKQK